MRRAVIDIGTNSVKLLVADVTTNHCPPLLEDSEQTRLGAGFFETRRLQPGAVSATAQAVARFVTEARENGARDIRIIATSAARDAINPELLIDSIRKSCGLEVRVISGEQEAVWAFQGVESDPRFASSPLALLDIGGGSTELIIGEAGRILFKQSYQLGTVRMLEAAQLSDPPTREQLGQARETVASFIRSNVIPIVGQGIALMPNGDPGVMLIGTGGTSVLLARILHRLDDYDRDQIESSILTLHAVQAQVEFLWALPLDKRRQIPGLPSNRADVILMGAVIFEAFMKGLGFDELRISTRGLRFGALMEE